MCADFSLTAQAGALLNNKRAGRWDLSLFLFMKQAIVKPGCKEDKNVKI